MKVLRESQRERDLELSSYLGVPLKTVLSWPLGSPDSKLILDKKETVLGPDGQVDEKKVISLYRSYKFMDVRKYLRTIMHTTITKRPPSLFRLLGGLRGGQVLDYGSGVGTHAIAALEMGCFVDLLDIKGPLRQFAEWRLKRRGLTNWRIFDHDAELEAGSYQCILCVDTLEHILHPVAALVKMLDALKIGGILYLLVAGPKIPRGHLKETWNEWDGEGRELLNKRCQNSMGPIYVKER